MSALDNLKESIQVNLSKLSISTSESVLTQSVVVNSTVESSAVIVNGTAVQDTELKNNTVSSSSLNDQIELGTLPEVTGCLVRITWQDELGNVLDVFDNICAQNIEYTFVPDIDFDVWDVNTATLHRTITGALTETVVVVHAKFPMDIRYSYCGEVVYTESRSVYIGQRLVLMHGYTTWLETSPYKRVGFDTFTKTITHKDVDNGLDIQCTDYQEVEFYNIEPWTQPKLTGQSTTVPEGTITCTASSAYYRAPSDTHAGEDNAAWHAMDGTSDGYINGTYWGPGSYSDTESVPENFGAWWQVKFPYEILIKGITVLNRYSSSESEQTMLSGAFYTDSTKKMMIGKPFTNSHRSNWWKTPISGIDPQGVATDTIYFFKENSDDWAGIGEIELNAYKLTKSNVSSFDFEYVLKQY